jgi:hypothetical protein
MANFIDAARIVHFHEDRELSLTCPHCSAFARMSVAAVPAFDDLLMNKPRHVGLVMRCHACNSPVFLRFAIKAFGGQRIELSPQYAEIERPKEKYAFNYVPERVELLFREALACYSNSLLQAFASMCQRTVQATFNDLGESNKLRLFDQVQDVRDIAEIDGETFDLVMRVMTGADGGDPVDTPILDSYQAAVLLEVMKDFLYQAYIRKGRLQHAMKVRRFFVEESISQSGRHRELRLNPDGSVAESA